MRIVQTHFWSRGTWGFFLVLSFTAWGQQRGNTPRYLNPYREPIRESEVRAVDAKSIPREAPDPSSPQFAAAEESARQRLQFATFSTGYLLGGAGTNGPRRPRHQMGIEGEFGWRQVKGSTGWDMGPKVALQILSGQTAVYGGFSFHYFGSLGLAGIYTQFGYRSSFQTRRERFSPVIGVNWRLFRPVLEAQSQWTFSIASEMDVDKSGLGWMVGFLLGKDFQW